MREILKRLEALEQAADNSTPVVVLCVENGAYVEHHGEPNERRYTEAEMDELAKRKVVIIWDL